jgi:hypothetical protein
MALARDPFIDDHVRTWDTTAARHAREDRASTPQFIEGARNSLLPSALVLLALSRLGARRQKR